MPPSNGWKAGKCTHCTLHINANAKCLLVINIYCINMNHIKFFEGHCSINHVDDKYVKPCPHS